MQGRYSQRATDVRTRGNLRSVHKTNEGTYGDAESSRSATAMSGFMAWPCVRFVCVPPTQLWCRFFTITQRASTRLWHTCGCYGMFVTLQLLSCPRTGCGRLAGSDLKARKRPAQPKRRIFIRASRAQGHAQRCTVVRIAASSGFLSLSATPTGRAAAT